MNVGANGKAILATSRQLMRDWNETKETWRDDQAAHLEETYLANLWTTIDRTAPLFEQLDRVLTKIKADCE